MQLTLAAIADYSMVAQDGKLSVIGIFERIRAQQFPAMHPRLDLALQIQCNPADAGKSRDVLISLIDEDGKGIAKVEGNIAVNEPIEGVHTVTSVMTFPNLVFDKPGRYQFDIYIGGRHESTLPLILEADTTSP